MAKPKTVIEIREIIKPNLIEAARLHEVNLIDMNSKILAAFLLMPTLEQIALLGLGEKMLNLSDSGLVFSHDKGFSIPEGMKGYFHES